MFFGNSGQIGISIGTSSIKIAELKKMGKSYSLSHFGVAQLPEGSIVNREIVNHMAIVDAIQGLVKELKIKGKPVCASISGGSVIVKKILLDQVPKRELEEAILFEAEQYVPFDISEVVFDFQVLNQSGPEGKMEILLVAVKRSLLESYVNVIKDGGLNVKIMDCDLFALQNSYEANFDHYGATVALVDVGASSTKTTICANAVPVYTRDSAVGGRDVTLEIQRQLNLSYQEAEVLKIDGQAQGQLPQEVTDLMHISAENISNEIKRSIDFYNASNSGSPVGSIYLSGGASKLPELSKTVEDNVGIPVQMLNPFQNVGFDSKIFEQGYINIVSGLAAIPVGLALRGFAR